MGIFIGVSITDASAHHANLIYYDMGLQDGYQQGMGNCGNAGVTMIDPQGNRWLRYEPVSAKEDVYPEGARP